VCSVIITKRHQAIIQVLIKNLTMNNYLDGGRRRAELIDKFNDRDYQTPVMITSTIMQFDNKNNR
jgi:hypothetical protein